MQLNNIPMQSFTRSQKMWKQVRMGFAFFVVISLFFSMHNLTSFAAKSTPTPQPAASKQATTSKAASLVIPKPYKDVAETDAAYRAIWKLLVLGVLKNESNAPFDPKRVITKQEAILLSVRWLGVEEEVKKRKSNVVLPFDVNATIKPYVIVAFEKGLISFSEEMQTAKNADAVKNWGVSPVNRQWLARLLERLVAKDATWPAVNNGTLSKLTTDSADVEKAFVPSITKLVQADIYKPDKNKKIFPKQDVVRSEFVQYLDALQQIQYAQFTGYGRGIVAANDKGLLKIQKIDGSETQVKWIDAGKWFKAEDGSKLNAKDLTAGANVEWIQQGDTALWGMLLKSDPTLVIATPSLSPSATIKPTATPKSKSTPSATPASDVTPTASVAPTPKSTATNALQTNRPATMNPTVTPSLTASPSITPSGAADATVWTTATLETVDFNKSTIIVLLDGTSIEPRKTLTITTASKFFDVNNNPILLNQLNPNDRVLIRMLQSELLQLIRMTSNNTSTFEGMYDSIYKNSLFTLKNNALELIAYTMQADTKFITENGKTINKANILSGDRIKVTVSGPRLMEVVLLKRELISKQSIASWDATGGILILSDDKSRLSVYRVTNETQLLTNGVASSPKTEQWNSVLKRGALIELTVRDQVIMTIQVSK